MWLLGHLAIGYLVALLISRISREKLFLPLVFLVSMLSDFDKLLQGYVVHRGPTHSLIFALVLFFPIIIFFRGGFTYLAVYLSHISADFFVPYISRVQLFWPITNAWFGAPVNLRLYGFLETVVEVILFALMLIVLWLNMDGKKRSSISSRIPYFGARE